MLKIQNVDFVDHMIFDDHHEYKEDDFKLFENKIKSLKPDFLITTEKDLIKFKSANKSIINMIYALPIQFSLSKICLEIILNKLDLN